MWHPQTSLPTTRAQVTLSFAFAVKLAFNWLAFAVKLVRWPRTSFTGNASQSKWECYLCTRSRQGKKIDFFSPWKMDFYHLGNWFIPPWKIDFWFATLEIDLYHRGFWFLLSWKITSYRLGIFFFLNVGTVPAFKCTCNCQSRWTHVRFDLMGSTLSLGKRDVRYVVTYSRCLQWWCHHAQSSEAEINWLAIMI